MIYIKYRLPPKIFFINYPRWNVRTATPTFDGGFLIYLLMTYKFYGDGEMEIIPDYETNELTIWIEGSFGCNSFTLDENNIDDVIEVLTKFKNKQTKWNHLSSN